MSRFRGNANKHIAPRSNTVGEVEMSIRILVADDHTIIRNGLRALLDSEPDMEVVAEAEDGRKTVQLARKLSPDVVIMDVTMPDLNGIEATRQILAESPDIKVIALSMHHHEQFVTEMFKAGASGYMLKDCSVEELTTAIRTAKRGDIYMSPSAATVIIRKYVNQLADLHESAKPLLTPREREVVQLVSEGKTSKEIASTLFISVKTVGTHKQHILEKLNLKSNADLIKYAFKKGLIHLE